MSDFCFLFQPFQATTIMNDWPSFSGWQNHHYFICCEARVCLFDFFFLSFSVEMSKIYSSQNEVFFCRPTKNMSKTEEIKLVVNYHFVFANVLISIRNACLPSYFVILSAVENVACVVLTIASDALLV